MSSTRCGISAKQLEREIGVTYKCAWRMFHLIRNQLMGHDGKPLEGVVETDETFVGGKPRKEDRKGLTRKLSYQWAAETKASVWGAVERDGRVVAEIIPFSGAGDIRPRVFENVKAGSTLYSDGFPVYRNLGVYDRAWVDHKHEEYVRGDVHTQTIEGFWSVMKGGLNGVYRGAVSKQHLQSYIDEYAFHWNTRTALGGPDPFRVLLDRATDA